MKFGIREICDVVLKAKSQMKIGDMDFAEGQPVLYFDSLKTSTIEGAATTVYAQGGKGNARLIAWEGERTVTFTMEDALISELGLAVLTGAGLVKAGTSKPMYVHATTRAKVEKGTDGKGTAHASIGSDDTIANTVTAWAIELDKNDNVLNTVAISNPSVLTHTVTKDEAVAVMFDFYLVKESGATEITINAKDFAGNYYLEASTLFRGNDGKDRPAEFIIPNAKIQSNFTFTMASSGDPSTFTFTMDAFPDYTKFDPTEKVFCRIQVIEEDAPLVDLGE